MPISTQSAPVASNAHGTLKRIMLQGRYETLAMLGNGEQLIVAAVLPLLALIGLVFTGLLDDVAESPIDAAAPGVLALCVISTAFTGQGIATGFDRRYGVLRFLSTTPLGRAGLIYGKVVAVLTVLVLQVIVIGGISLLMGWRPAVAGIPAGIALLVLGAAAFTALGLLVAGTVRPEATLAITNLAWVLLAAVGGILFPSNRAPDYLQPFVDLLPSAALGDSLRSALISGSTSVSGILILLAWTIIAGFAATRWFKWN
ncbi:ABC transporter permease [Paeniglutamicibacter gangotriensis]|uniref:Transport permease protein n=2 Tax=Paeniglutamicibacter gangotriensis TaxID=254787 RepID=M7N5P3_9MICC|nr:ABC transporter permease [Paeniglutamicibacter gangotriensis]EMQ97084.1 ABC transporter permease [Paeniglutamicibacter gangotriensis Lz1y]KAA0979866.1 ABC transporter permease [Paeniglutamicibacter gangotriensis]